MTKDHLDLNGMRVLVVEDSLLVAEVIAETLASYGCEVVGPVARLGRGVQLAETEALDGALLDVNLAGELSFPIASALQARGVPFIFLTGYGDLSGMPGELQGHPTIGKPFDNATLVGLISRSFHNAA